MSFSYPVMRETNENGRSQESILQASFPAPSVTSIGTRPSLKPSLKSSWSYYHGGRQNLALGRGHSSSSSLGPSRRRSASLPRSWGMSTDQTAQVNTRSCSLPATPPPMRPRAKSVHFKDEEFVEGFVEEASTRRLVDDGQTNLHGDDSGGSDSPSSSSWQVRRAGEEGDLPPITRLSDSKAQRRPGTLQVSDLGPIVPSPKHASSRKSGIPRRPALIQKRHNSNSFDKAFKGSQTSSSSSSSSSSTFTSSNSGSSIYELASTSPTSLAPTTTFILEPRFDATVYYALALAGPAYYHTQLGMGAGASSSSSYARPVARRPVVAKATEVEALKIQAKGRPEFLARTSSSSNSTGSSSSSGSVYPSSSSGDSNSNTPPLTSSVHGSWKPQTRRRRVSRTRHPQVEQHSFQTHGKVFDQAEYYALALAGPVYYQSQLRGSAGAGGVGEEKNLLLEYRSRGQAWATWVVGAA